MPTPTLRTSTSAASTTAVNSIVVTAPTGLAAGDLCILIGAAAGTPGFSATGFQAVNTHDNNSTTFDSNILYRVCDGTEGASFTLNITQTKSIAVVCVAAVGVAVRTPFDPQLLPGQVNTANSLNIQSNGLTTLGDTDLLLWAGITTNGGGVACGAITLPASYASAGAQINSTVASAQNVGIQAGSLAQASAATITGPTGTCALSKASNAYLIALATHLDDLGVVV